MLMLPESVNLHELIDVVITTLDARDPYTYEHSFRVAQYAEIIAYDMGLSKMACQSIHIAAHLHDIGKIGVQDRVLNKGGKLTTEEMLDMQAHSRIGANILKRTSIFQEISDIALYHHERFDGLGYPTGLKGDAIPLESRIIAVVDSFDAMTSNRPYRQGMQAEAAANEIFHHNNQQFCPIIVKHFQKIFDQLLPYINGTAETLADHYAFVGHEDLMHSKIVHQ